jgi:hypothetical protein
MNPDRLSDDVPEVMGQRHISLYRPESSLKQVGYLLILALVGVTVMFAGLGLLDIILGSVQG